jgi:hypothetical protein
MKRAKEYAKMFIDNPTNEFDVLSDIITSFIGEIYELMSIRNAKSNDALLSILDEQERKWKSFANKVGINPEGFSMAILACMPEVFPLWKPEKEKTK